MSRVRRVVVAPDKFKGSLRAAEVADAIAGVLAQQPGLEVLRHPVADGGEGTVELALGLGFDPVDVEVTGPLGRPVRTTFAVRDRTAVLEMSSAAGLALLPAAPDPRTAWSATTYGVGELIRAAVSRGATYVVVGAGGSATTDGGAGAVEALGIDVAALGRHPHRAGRPRTPPGERLAGVDLVVACDVDNPLTGPDGAASVYAPQKGADPPCVAALETRMTAWADAVAAATGQDLRHLPGAGSAGGLGFGLVALAGARLASGTNLLLELTGFDVVAASADLVIVGEGSLDKQSLRGKGPVGVARAASARGTTVIAVAGRNELSELEEREAGLSKVYSLGDMESDPAVCMRDARRLLRAVAGKIADDWG
ncbi:glycerate kinase [Nocardioides sp.]|uniref:glycerate kinase n=1 Tax=Nocardioides sp. TaxID=35761 RepID=UPI0026072C70|nr:glycerate kinase [Nocardioides sp.]